MDSQIKTQPAPERRAGREHFRILELLILVTGAGIALTLCRPIWTASHGSTGEVPIEMVPFGLRIVVVVLGGFSLVGVPLLLAGITRRRTPWGPGKVAWFAQGLATWLLWPPIIYYQSPLHRGGPPVPWSSACWLWGTPLMGLYITLAVLAGGWFGRRGRRRMNRSWKEQFGLVLSCLWACTGLYILGLLYWMDLLEKR